MKRWDVGWDSDDIKDGVVVSTVWLKVDQLILARQKQLMPDDTWNGVWCTMIEHAFVIYKKGKTEQQLILIWY